METVAPSSDRAPIYSDFINGTPSIFSLQQHPQLPLKLLSPSKASVSCSLHLAASPANFEIQFSQWLDRAHTQFPSSNQPDLSIDSPQLDLVRACGSS